MRKGSSADREVQPWVYRRLKPEALRRSRHAAAQARYRKRMTNGGVVQLTLLVPAQHGAKFKKLAQELRNGRSLTQALEKAFVVAIYHLQEEAADEAWKSALAQRQRGAGTWVAPKS